MKRLNFLKLAVFVVSGFLFFTSAKTAATFASMDDAASLENIVNEIKSYEYRETKYQVEILEILAKSQKENIPLSSLVNKIKEGLAKDISLKVIRDAIIKSKRNLILSSSLLKEFKLRGIREGMGESGEEAVISLSEFLTRGLTEKTAREISKQIIRKRGDVSRFITLSGVFIDLKGKDLKDDTIWLVINMILGQDIKNVDAKELVSNIYRKIDSGKNIDVFVRKLSKTKPTRVLLRK